MPWIRRRRNGWLVAWRNKDRRERSKFFRTREEAEAFVALLLESARSPLAEARAIHSVGRGWPILMLGACLPFEIETAVREEVMPKNILMIGPTGVGKTEISRRLARLAGAPFIKVEATKFTEVGYVGRDVEQIIRDLVEVAIGLTRQSMREDVKARAHINAEERVLEALVGKTASPATRDSFRKKLRNGEMDDKEIEIETSAMQTSMEIFAPPGMEDLTSQIQNMFQNLGTGRKREKFPSTSTAKTTTCDIEIITGDGDDYEMVVSFLPKDLVRQYVEECVTATAISLLKGERRERSLELEVRREVRLELAADHAAPQPAEGAGGIDAAEGEQRHQPVGVDHVGEQEERQRSLLRQLAERAFQLQQSRSQRLAHRTLRRIIRRQQEHRRHEDDEPDRGQRPGDAVALMSGGIKPEQRREAKQRAAGIGIGGEEPEHEDEADDAADIAGSPAGAG